MVLKMFNVIGLLGILSLVSVSLAMPKASPAKQPERLQSPWQPYPPPKTCDVCDIFETGVADTKPLLKSIKEKAQKAPECVAKITVLAGPMSGTVDHDPSSVECPVGTTLINCRCSIENQECEGASSNGRKCTAFKGVSNPPTRVQAIATCVPSCTGTFTIEQTPLVGLQAGLPVAMCPTQTEIVGCWIYGFNTIPGYHFPRIDSGSRSCQPLTTCGSGGCSVKALCKAV